MFRIIENLLSLLGYIFSILLITFGLYPLEKTNKELISLSTIYNSECTRDTIKVYTQSDILNLNLGNLSNELNSKISITQIKQLLDTINKVLKYSNKDLQLEIEKCVFPDNNLEKYILKAKKYFENKKNITAITDTDQYLIGISQIPLLSISNIHTKNGSLLAHTNLCGGSIINRNMYLFIWNTSISDEFKINGEVVLFKFNSVNNENNNMYYDFIKNIINSVHYVKYIFSCK